MDCRLSRSEKKRPERLELVMMFWGRYMPFHHFGIFGGTVCPISRTRCMPMSAVMGLCHQNHLL
jgi:hypothetical protein